MRPIKDRNRTVPCGCGGTFYRVPSLPAQAQGDFGTPRKGNTKARSSYRMEKYTDERLSGKRDSELGEQLRRLDREPQAAKGLAESGMEARNKDLQ